MATKQSKGASKIVLHDGAAREMPRALVVRAKAAEAAGRERHRQRGEELLLLVQQKKREIAGGFWDIGAAVAELSRREVYRAMGFATFDALVTEKMDMAPSTARKLATIAKRLSRSAALSMGQERAAALLALADARGEEDAAKLGRSKIALPGRHEKVRPETLGANELKRAARDERLAHRTGKTARARALGEVTDVAASLVSRAEKAGIELEVHAQLRSDGAPRLRIVVAPEFLRKLGKLLSKG